MTRSRWIEPSTGDRQTVASASPITVISVNSVARMNPASTIGEMGVGVGAQAIASASADSDCSFGALLVAAIIGVMYSAGPDIGGRFSREVISSGISK